jgi:hypothetical protein
MDRTAIASIIIGCGATVAAMVMPQKYPSAPKTMVDLSWWGGIFLMVVGVLMLATDVTTRDILEFVVTAYTQCSRQATVALRNPLSWIVLAFLAGIAVQRWIPMLWKKMPLAHAPSRQVTEWLSLMQAAERFVDPEFMARDRKAREKAQQFEQGTQEREDADYLAKHRREDVTGCLRGLLKNERLVAKGCQLKIINGSTVVQPESAITNPFWGIIVGGMDCLVLEKNEAVGGFPATRFINVVIGKPN